MELTQANTLLQVEEFTKASVITNYLKKLYPGYRWACAVDTHQGVIHVMVPFLMETNVPYIIRIDEVKQSEKVLAKALMLSGGEILERFRLSREQRSMEKGDGLMSELPSNFKGEFLFDHRGNKNWLGKGAAL